VIDVPGVTVAAVGTVFVANVGGVEVGETGELEQAIARRAIIVVMGARVITDLDRNIKGLCLGYL
jgi:hypothetical protein